MNTFFLSCRNVFRNKRRTLFTTFSIVVGVASLLLFDGFVKYTLWGLRESTIKNGLGHLQITKNEKYFTSGSFDPFEYLLQNQDSVIKVLKQVPAVKKVVPQINFSGNISLNGKTGIVMINASPPELSTELFGFRSIVEGRDLNEDEMYTIILGDGVAKKMDAKIGDEVTVLTTVKGGGVNAVDFKVVGICTMGNRELDNIMVYTTLSSANEFLFINTVPLLIVVLDNTDNTAVVDKTLTEMLSKANLQVSIKTWDELADYYQQAKELYENMQFVTRIIIMAVVIFVIINTMTMAVMERFREIGTIRAIGTKKIRVMEMFVIEGSIIGILGGIAGVLLGFILSWGINLLGGVYIPPPPGRSSGYYAMFTPSISYAFSLILTSLLVSFSGSIYPSYKAIKMKIAESLRHV